MGDLNMTNWITPLNKQRLGRRERRNLRRIAAFSKKA